MREITKTVSVQVDGKPLDFRLTKLDAFSGAALLRLLSSVPKDAESDSVIGFIRHLSVPDRVFDRTSTNLVYTLLATTVSEQ